MRNPEVHHHGIVPPHLLRALATSGRAELEERARETLRLDQLRRDLRSQSVSRSATRATTQAPNRFIHDAGNRTGLPGTRVRAEGQPATDDPAVNEAYDGLGATWRLWHEAYGRNSLDDRGLGLVATVHYGQHYDNAFWDGSQMVFGDGDGEVFLGFTRSLDVIGHELAHGVTQYTSGLNYQDQAGALNEHVSDVFGILVKQRALGQSAEDSDWIIGAELLGPDINGVAVLAAVIYLCYGGTFGTMPATAGDFFGVRNAGAIYGLMLVGWSLGGIIGPIVASALIGEEKAYTMAYTTIGIIALASVALTLVTKVPGARRGADHA